MMILFEGRSLNVKNRFMPERLQLQLTERNSTATITVGNYAPTVAIGDWLQCEDGPAKGIVWRVKSIETQYDTGTRVIQLEHLICKLKDRLMFGEIKPDTISGGSGNPMASATVRYILGYQDDWVLGDVERDRENPYSFNGESLYAALETVSASLTECLWEYDFSRYPFVLHLRSINMNVVSEMRTDRNIKSLRKVVDRSRMYTRHYPIGKEDLHISGDFVSKNEGVYGIVCKTETDQSIDSESALRQWALERLERHCQPLVTVTVSGLDLSEATGEPLDKFKIGKACRIPLPEYDTTIIERVSKLSYPDLVKTPESVTVTLANEVPDVATIIRQEQQKSASGGRGAAKKAGEDHAWFVDTDDHVGMIAEAVAGPGAARDWSRVSSVIVDGQGIHQRVTTVYDEVERHESAIEVQEDFIDATVKAVGANGKITAASICLAINNGGSSATINADKIYLLGETIAQKITADYIKAKVESLSALSVKTLTARSLMFSASGGIYANVASAVNNISIRQSGNDYTLWVGHFNGTIDKDITFSRAVASWTLGWSNGTFTAKANPQNQSCWTEIGSGTASWDGKTVTIPIVARNSSSPGTSVSTGKSVTATYSGGSWNYGTLNESNSQPSGSKYYDLDTRYTYHSFSINVDGESKTIVLRT